MMGMDNVVFLEVIEWFDQTGREIVHRVPERGSGEIKLGAQLTVRESQSAVFFYNGKAVDVLGAGRHTLRTANLPVLTKLLSLPWAMTSPLRAEVYFVNLKTFTNLTWGTKNPVAFKDSRLGLVRLRAFGMFNLQVLQPALFINRLVGTQGQLSTQDVEDYLSKVIVSRFNDVLGDRLDTLFDLPGQYDELSEALQASLREDFSHFGLGLPHLYINSITPPQEVQQAIDDKGRLAMFDDLDRLMKMKAAMAMERLAEGGGASAPEAGQAMGMGMGFMMPSMLLAQMQGSGGGAGTAPAPAIACPDCGGSVAADARFCPACGHQLVVMRQCVDCGKNLPPGARFCPRCGASADKRPAASVCPKCGSENLGGSTFCNQCGERIG